MKNSGQIDLVVLDPRRSRNARWNGKGDPRYERLNALGMRGSPATEFWWPVPARRTSGGGFF